MDCVLTDKHLTAYVEKLQTDGKSASTVKTDLAAIRFFHDKLDRAKYQLPSNEELSVELERRRFGRVDRTWSIREFNLFLATCVTDGHEDYAARTYEELIVQAATALEANLQVSRLLGHERPDVTRIYLASVKDGIAAGRSRHKRAAHGAN